MDKAESLALLTAKKDHECEQAVKKAHEYEQKVTKDIVMKLKQTYEARVTQEANKIHDKLIQIEKLKKQVEEVEDEKKRLASFLHTTRFWFQDFIDRVQKVQKGQADFMLPPAYIEEIERGLMEPL